MQNQSEKKLTPAWVSTLYYAQGLPFSLVRQVSVVFFKDQGLSLKELGLVSLYGIPWTFKFLWSPLVDTISTKRRWIVVMEWLLALVVGAVAFFASHTNVISSGAGSSGNHMVQIIALLFLIIAFVAATHDTAIDGFYLEALSRDQQAQWSGLLVASYRVALLTGAGALVSLSGKFGWAATFGIAAFLLLALSFWHQFFLPHLASRQAEKVNQAEPSATGSLAVTAQTKEPARRFHEFAEGFAAFIKLPGIVRVVVFAVLFKLGDALLFGMSTPFLLDAGLSKAQLGLYSGFFGVTAGIGASMFGGWFISRFKLKRGLYLFGVLQNMAIPVYAFVAWKKLETTNLPHWILGVAVVVEQIAAGLGTAAYNNFLMRQNDHRYKATHYAIVTGMMALTTMLGGLISGFAADRFGYAVFFTLAFFASLPGLALVPMVAHRPECQ